MSEPAIALRDVVKRFGPLTALDAVSLTIQPGRLVAILGWNAAGKSTLLRLLAGLMEPDAGTIAVSGHDIRRNRAGARRLIGYVPQNAGVDEFLSVEETLDLRADLCDVTGATRHARMVELLDLTGLTASLHIRVSALPLGTRRRLGLACALISAPRILLLDELTAGLDSLSRRAIFPIIRHLVEGGVTILWGTSAIDEAERCDELVLLHEGRVIDQGAPSVFTRRAKGHVRVIKSAGPRKHEAAAVLQGQPGVLDARIEGDAVRLIVDREDRSIGHGVPDGAEAPQVAPPTPEDAVILSLRHHATGATSLSQRPPASRRATGYALEVRGLRKCFGGRAAIEGLSFAVGPGEIFGIVGPNGSGKSSVLQMLGGSLRPTEGRIVAAEIGRSTAPSVAGAKLGYMSQAFSLYEDLTVRQNLRFLAATRRMDRRERAERMAQAAAECGLEAHLDTRSGDLTFATRRRLALAAALLHDPDILLLDEPSFGTDPLTRRDLWHRIDAAAANGAAVVVASHLVEDADSCDRILLLSRGHAIATGTADELKAMAASVGSGATLDDAITSLVLDWERRCVA